MDRFSGRFFASAALLLSLAAAGCTSMPSISPETTGSLAAADRRQRGQERKLRGGVQRALAER